jgi:peroxiredoxin family protein
MNDGLIEKIEELVEQKLDTRLNVLEEQIKTLLSQVEGQKEPSHSNRLTLVAFSSDMDKLLAAFIIATGAAAVGMEVSIFFTFWGLTALRKKTTYQGKPALKKIIGAMLPSGPNSVGTSNMNMCGMGPSFFKTLMKKDNIASLPELIDLAQELDVELTACQMSMGLMGIERTELLDGIEYGGVAAYLEKAANSKITLFV